MTKFKNIVVAVASLVIFANITNAQAVKANYSVNAEEPLNVKYLGSDGDYLLFKVTLQSNTPSKAFFAIDDKNEGQLYTSGLATTLKVETIKIEKRDNDQVLNFKFVLKNKTYMKTFSVNTNLVETTTVAESDVTKL